MKNEVQLWLDCDGVLADFDKRFFEMTGEDSRGYEKRHGEGAFWAVIDSDPDFFYNLEPMPDAFKLYEAVKHLDPIILTGVHYDHHRPQKLRWRDKIFPGVEMITCLSKDKYLHMVPGKFNIIVDDWHKHAHVWDNAGGKFVIHTSAEESIEVLKDLGVL